MLGVILFENEIVKPINTFEVIVSFVVSIFLQIIIHELGHMEAGLLSGYEFSSFRICSFTWIKDEEKAQKELKQFNSLKKNYPYKGDLESEEELLQLIQEISMKNE